MIGLPLFCLFRLLYLLLGIQSDSHRSFQQSDISLFSGEWIFQGCETISHYSCRSRAQQGDEGIMLTVSAVDLTGFELTANVRETTFHVSLDVIKKEMDFGAFDVSVTGFKSMRSEDDSEQSCLEEYFTDTLARINRLSFGVRDLTLGAEKSSFEMFLSETTRRMRLLKFWVIQLTVGCSESMSYKFSSENIGMPTQPLSQIYWERPPWKADENHPWSMYSSDWWLVKAQGADGGSKDMPGGMELKSLVAQGSDNLFNIGMSICNDIGTTLQVLGENAMGGLVVRSLGVSSTLIWCDSEALMEFEGFVAGILAKVSLMHVENERLFLTGPMNDMLVFE